MQNLGTYFYLDGKRIGSDEGVIPIPLRIGMKITIHSFPETFEVVDWNYHHGHGDEEAGLRIYLKKANKIAKAR